MKRLSFVRALLLVLAILFCSFASAEAYTVNMGDELWFLFDFTSSSLPGFNGINGNGIVTNPSKPPEVKDWYGKYEMYDEITDASPKAWSSVEPLDSTPGFSLPETTANAGLFDDYVFYIVFRPTSWTDTVPVTHNTPLDISMVARLYKFDDTGVTGSTNNIAGIPVNPVNPVPEPTNMLLLGFGLIGLAGMRRKITQITLM